MESKLYNTREVKEELMNGFSDYLDSQEFLTEDNVNMMAFLPRLLKLQNQKSMVYGRSYCKHKDMSIFFNVERKWDRVSNIMERAMCEGISTLYSEKSSTPTETFVDTIVDLASYSCLWASFIMAEHPEEYAKFLRDNNLLSQPPRTEQ